MSPNNISLQVIISDVVIQQYQHARICLYVNQFRYWEAWFLGGNVTRWTMLFAMFVRLYNFSHPTIQCFVKSSNVKCVVMCHQNLKGVVMCHQYLKGVAMCHQYLNTPHRSQTEDDVAGVPHIYLHCLKYVNKEYLFSD